MQHTFDQTAARIAARNTAENIRTRLTLRFSLLYFSAFVAGLLLCRVLPPLSLPPLRDMIQASIRPPLTDCALARDAIRAILLSAKYELALLIALTVSGMTLFCDRVCGLLTMLFGLRGGIFCFGVIGLTVHQPIFAGSLLFCLFFFALLGNAAVLLNAATESVIFSYRYRDTAHGLRRERDAVSVQFILHILCHTGILIVIAAARAILWAAIQKM